MGVIGCFLTFLTICFAFLPSHGSPQLYLLEPRSAYNNDHLNETKEASYLVLIGVAFATHPTDLAIAIKLKRCSLSS